MAERDVELAEVFAAIAREEQARADLASYLRNARLRRVEPDDEHEDSLRAEVDSAAAAVQTAMTDRRATVRRQYGLPDEDDAYEPTEAGLEAVKR